MIRRLFLALLVALAALPARAEQQDYPITPEEQAAWTAAEGDDRLVRARELAAAILAKDPDSFVALYVMALVAQHGDANLPRAAWYARRARTAIERRWGDSIPENGPWQWHARTLRLLIEVTAQMDRKEEALELLAFRDQRYAPKLSVEYGWPLMKLGRTDEARTRMEQVLASGTFPERMQALNTLGAMEHELDDPEASFQDFNRIISETEADGSSPDATTLRNAAEAASALLRFDEAERDLLRATEAFEPATYSNPWQDLALLWMGEGRFQEALRAVREMQAWAHSTLPVLDQQSWADRQTTAAAFLLEAGFEDEAIRLLEQILARPDRRAGTTAFSDQSTAGQLLLLRHALRLRRARTAEQGSWSGPLEGGPLLLRRLADDYDLWRAGRRAAALVIDHRRLHASLRYLAPDGVSAVGWTMPELVGAVGPGVVAVETEALLARTGPAGQRERPYVLLFHGESLLERGRTAAATAALEEAAATLPRAEALLRARAAALLALLAQRGGDLGRAVALYEEALALHPPVLRALEVALPVTIADDGSAAARAAVRILSRSPRFERGRYGFSLRVTSGRQGLAATLATPDGAQLVAVAVKAGPDPGRTARTLAAELHRHAFAVHLDLAQADVASLEGSTLTGRDLRDALGELLGRRAAP